MGLTDRFKGDILAKLKELQDEPLEISTYKLNYEPTVADSSKQNNLCKQLNIYSVNKKISYRTTTKILGFDPEFQIDPDEVRTNRIQENIAYFYSKLN